MTCPRPADHAVPDLEAAYLADRRRRFKEAVARVNRRPDHVWPAAEFPGPLQGIAGALFAHQWLRRHVAEPCRAAVAAVSRNPAHASLVRLLLACPDAPTLVAELLREWLPDAPGRYPLLQQNILARWATLDPFREDPLTRQRAIQQEQKREYGAPLSPLVLERLALVDSLPDPGPAARRFVKAGVIPVMACPQSCRHCMFVWRPSLGVAPDQSFLWELLPRLTNNLLFTGGDLSGHLDGFFHAITHLTGITTCAILLNGSLGQSLAAAREFLERCAAARRRRPAAAPVTVVIQISFDEFHQEILADRHGVLRERIPVARVANLLQAALDHPELQLVLLHKQNRLNFSTALFQQGVFARLDAELARRGLPIRVESHAPAPRPKADPVDPVRRAGVIREAVFTLGTHRRRPFHFVSSTLDAYGRAAVRVDPAEYVAERPLLQDVLAGRVPPGEAFDTDLMFRVDGPVTLFSAFHICLGDLGRDGADRILARHRKDPLLRALERFDPRLPVWYGEVRNDLSALVEQATGPYHLFHRLTREAEVRLALTRRLVGFRAD
ncbi:MAG: hypothetical protein HQL82_05205 [Magnetococcales bacterium]|nr:hypothetical protein [Magnetococcales bacterium]